MANEFFDTHRQRLDGALDAIASRGYWSAFPEVPSGKIYGETAKADGAEAFKARLGTQWSGQDIASSGTVLVSLYRVRADMNIQTPAVRPN